MAQQLAPHCEPLWQLLNHRAALRASLLSADVNLHQPQLGLQSLVWNSNGIPGHLLGVTVALQDESTPASMFVHEPYVRGIDLVANFPQSQNQPFTVQTYWRAEKVARGVQIDAILSLQTSLLECYPRVTISTQLPANEIWMVPPGVATARLLTDWNSATTVPHLSATLLRGTDDSWSYCEMTHPEDQGTVEIRSPREGFCQVQRTLGGDFQEKGVIRRMRIRGVFLPRANDLESAAEIFADFAAAPAPLTA